MTRCFTCNRRISGEPAMIEGRFGDNTENVILPVCTVKCAEEQEWTNMIEDGDE